MRILTVNKFFYPHAGAETVFFNERQLLSDRGHELVDFGMQSDRNVDSPWSRHFARERRYIGVSRRRAAGDAIASIYSLEARARLADLLEDAKPDIAHLHNVYHQLTLSIIDALRARHVPVVMTLHDYKISCPAYTFFRDGQPCHLCAEVGTRNVLRHRCIKGSLPASFLAFLEARMARIRRMYHKLDALIAPSGFVAQVAVRAGIDPDAVVTLPNFLLDADVEAARRAQRDSRNESTFVFIGRLDDVKGVIDLLDIWSHDPPGRLVIAGSGPLESDVATRAASLEAVEFLGRVERDQVLRLYAGATAAVLPSRWEENCPMTLLEARAAGAIPVCTASGGFLELVDDGVDGFLAPPRNPRAWSDALRRAIDPGAAAAVRKASTQRLRAEHSESAHYRRLMDVYARAAERSRDD